MAVAVVAAAVADPLVEFTSNAGLFGRGGWTDHSNLDVLPALFVGFLFVGLSVVLKARAALHVPDHSAQALLRASGRALASGMPRLLVLAFMLQMVALYVMETTEQLIVWGHGLGPAVWLGGPLPFSLAIHAITCVVVAFAIARSVRALAATTLRVIRLIQTLVTFDAQVAQPKVRRRHTLVAFNQSAPVLCRIGERAPPLLTI